MSLLKGTELSRALRFYMILLAIPMCFAVKDKDFGAEDKVFIYIAVAKSIMLIGIAAWLLCTQNYAPFRSWAKAGGYGDIYIIQKIPRVQVHGNALLMVAFMLNYSKKSRWTFSNIILLLGILSAGNFAFFLGLAAFAAYRMGKRLLVSRGKRQLEKMVVVVLGFCCLLAMLPYVNYQIIQKSEYSNKVRIEQAKALTDSVPLTGNGLGYKVITENEILAPYNGSLYYELQTLYILNQIGVFGGLIFYAVTLWAAYKNGKECFWIYILYLFYSFWNPYCFDTTQMLAILAIINAKLIKTDKRDRYCNGVLYKR